MEHLKGWRPKRRESKYSMRNEDRANRAMQAVNAWAMHGSSEDEASDLGDCLADLCHYAASIGLEPSNVFDMALTHFESER